MGPFAYNCSFFGLFIRFYCYFCGVFFATGMEDVLQLNVESMMRRKMGRKPSWLLVRFFSWFVKEDWFNKIFIRIGNRKGVDFMVKAIEELDIKLVVSGLENLPSSGERCVFACNHPLGGADVLAAVSVVGPSYPEGLVIPANDILMALSPIREMLIPVNKLGGQSRLLLQNINDSFASAKQIMFYPSGKVSRLEHGIIRDDVWAKNFICKAVEFNRSIVPVHIEGRNSWFFYTLANLRKKLGVRFNIEMMRLPREVYYQCGRTLRVTIGKPIAPEFFDSSRTDFEWAQYVKGLVYEL